MRRLVRMSLLLFLTVFQLNSYAQQQLGNTIQKLPSFSDEKMHAFMQDILLQMDAFHADSSVHVIDQALHYIDKEKDIEEFYYLLSYRAEVLYYEGLFNEAMKDLDKCAILAERLKDSVLIANVYNLKGLLHENIQESDHALMYMKKARAFFPNNPKARYPTSELHHIYGNMGSYLTSTGQLDSAEINLNISLQLAKEAGAARATAVANWSLGQLALKRENVSEASLCFRRSFEVAEMASDHDIGLNALVGLVQAEQAAGSRAGALDYLDKAHEHLSRFKIGIGLVTQRDFFRNASLIYSQIGELHGSISALKQWHQIDSLITKRNIESALNTQAALLRSDADLAMERLQLQETALTLERVEFSRRVLLFAVIFGLLFLSFVFLSYRNKRRNENLLGQAELLRLRQEKTIAELTIREQVSRDMHDDLGAGLSAMKLKTEMALRVEKDPIRHDQMKSLSGTAGELIDSMRQIIWSMSDDQKSIEDLVVYISNYARTYLADYGISIIYEPWLQWPEYELSSAQRRNVFLIVKEALHNVVKHASADQVNMEITWKKKGLMIQIRDNGIGMQNMDILNSGNGLKNMKNRAQEMKGGIEWENSEGMIIRFWMPIPTN